MKTNEETYPIDIDPEKWYNSYTTKERIIILREWFIKNDMPKWLKSLTKQDVFDLLNYNFEND